MAPAAAEAARAAAREWLAAHPEPSGRDLAEAGYVVPHWPRPWGLDAGPAEQLAIDEELAAAGVRRPDNPIGIGWAGPTILHAGTDGQKARFLPPALSGEEFWCQLFSEPDAGSDLANLATRAERDGDTYVVTGQKIWTTWAERADYGILLARTNPDAPKHRGISYLLCPMRQPGIEIRPLREMTGGFHFNEVFLDEVRVPAENLVGGEGDGWKLAVVTLGNERVSLSSGGLLWGMGPTTADFLDLVRARGGIADPRLRQRAASVYIEAEILRMLGERVLARVLDGRPPGPEASMKKLLADIHGQHVTELAMDLAGAGGMLADRGPLGTVDGPWPYSFLFARALTIGGGTTQVQRGILAEKVLGLPRETDAAAGLTWAEARRAAGAT